MATSVKLSFPSTAKVFVQAFSNASFNQQVTITPPSGAPAQFAGSGEVTRPMNRGSGRRRGRTLCGMDVRGNGSDKA